MLGKDGTRIKIYSASMIVVETDRKKDRTVFEIRGHCADHSEIRRQ